MIFRDSKSVFPIFVPYFEFTTNDRPDKKDRI